MFTLPDAESEGKYAAAQGMYLHARVVTLPL